MIIVSDTSPINYLVLLGIVDILPKMFGKMIVPPAVMMELTRPETPATVRTWAESPPEWLLI